jgi:hypothetical protein
MRPRVGYPILPFQVQQLQRDLSREENGEQVIYSYRIRHDPEDCMYPHCEVEVWSRGQLVTNVPGIIRKKLRDEIAAAQEKHVLFDHPLPTD